MPKSSLEDQIAAVGRLRHEPLSEDSLGGLKRALAARSNLMVAKAASVAADLNVQALVADLVTALRISMAGGAKADPQCWAKEALVKALSDLDHDASSTFIPGLRYTQYEPTMGGRVDTAPGFRGICALALVACRDLPNKAMLQHLMESLLDKDQSVRVAAATAIGRIDDDSAALLLRLKALNGDEASEVIGACFSGILSIDRADGIGFVSSFFSRGEDVAVEAAFALALMRDEHALEVVLEYSRPSFYPAIASSQQERGYQHLFDVVQGGGPQGRAAREALEAARLPDEWRERLRHC